MPSANLAADLCRFIDASPTPYHAVQQMVEQLVKAGFVLLRETDSWQLKEQTG